MKTKQSFVCGNLNRAQSAKVPLLIFAVILALAFVACDIGGNKNTGDPFDALPAADRWSRWADDASTVTITHSVANDGVCTITVGGTALTTQPLYDYLWKASAGYKYTAQAGKYYEYKFEAWTDVGTRKVQLQWYADNSTSTYHGTKWIEDPTETFTPGFEITNTRTTYTVTATEAIPKSGVQDLSFQCANKTGEFYVKILSINEYNGIPAKWHGIYTGGTIKIIVSAFSASVYQNDAFFETGNISIQQGGTINAGNDNIGEWVYSIYEGQRMGILVHSLYDQQMSANEIFLCGAGTQGVQGIVNDVTAVGAIFNPTPQTTYPDFGFWMSGMKQ